MSRRAPAGAEDRRAHIAECKLTPGTLALDVAIDALANVERHTTSYMTKIRYQDPEVIRLYGLKKTVNPFRLRPAQIDDIARKRQEAVSRAVRSTPEELAEQLVEKWLETFAERSTNGIDELKAAIAEAINAERALS